MVSQSLTDLLMLFILLKTTAKLFHVVLTKRIQLEKLHQTRHFKGLQLTS